MTHSSSLAEVRKPRKDFPLFPHATGRWAKKVRGKLRYFGKTADDPKGEAALTLWLTQRDDLLAGRTPRDKLGGLTLRDLCNKFLDYSRTTDLLIDTFGRDRLVTDLRPDDFEVLHERLTAKHGITTLGREITMVRSVFKYAVESDLIERAVKFGPQFRTPSKVDRRKLRAKKKHEHGAKMFAAEELRRWIKAAGPQLKAMCLLGINGGLGNTDCSTLPLTALDLTTGWLDFPRPKTGVERRIPLWPETIAALKVVLAKRQQPRDETHAGLVFLTRLGKPWVRYEVAETKNEEGRLDITSRADDAIAKATSKLLKTLGIYRRNVTFYALRHTFETIAGGCRDQVAVDAVMGHIDNSMAGEYREHIEDSRLCAVVDYVRNWLFPASAKAKKPSKAKPRGAKVQRDQRPLRVVG